MGSPVAVVTLSNTLRVGQQEVGNCETMDRSLPYVVDAPAGRRGVPILPLAARVLQAAKTVQLGLRSLFGWISYDGIVPHF